MLSPSTRHGIGVASATALALVAPLAVALPAHASSERNEIVYTADDDNDGVYGIVLRDLETDQVRTVLPADEFLYDDPELSPKGDRIAFSTDRGSEQYEEGIAVVERDGKGFRRLTEPPAGPEGTWTYDVAPAWSPDGSQMLFTRVREDDRGITTSLWTVRVADPLSAAQVPNTSDGYVGDWHPDGQQIVYAALPADQDDGQITVIRRDGTQRRAVTGAVGAMPTWSPDGSTIAFARLTEHDDVRGHVVTQIATVPAAGGTVTTLSATRPTSAPTIASYPAWSPDGQSLLFDLFGHSGADDWTPGDVWAVDVAGTRAGPVTTSRGDDAQPHAQGPVPTRVSAGTASTYTAVTPKRILDTRTGTGVRAGKVGPGGTVDLAVAGVQTAQGAVPSNATAVVLNVTVTDTSSATDVRAYPTGSAVPLASSLNAGARATVPNLVTVRLGSTGRVTLRNSGGTVNLIADIAGYYTPDANGAGFAAMDPSRILDTRSGLGARQARVGSGRWVDLQVTGGRLPTADGTTVAVPSNARAVVLNVTATSVSSGTDVRVYPVAAGSGVPLVSNLNLLAGKTAANLVTVAVGDGGKVRLRNHSGELHLIADIAGYYAAGATGRFVPVAPLRFLDTRSGTGAAPVRVSGGAFLDLAVAGSRRGVPAGATAAVLNLTATGVSGTAGTFLQAYPPQAARVPTVSNLNLGAGETRANLAIVRTGSDGRVRLRNHSGSLDVIADLAGYMVG